MATLGITGCDFMKDATLKELRLGFVNYQPKRNSFRVAKNLLGPF